jgi:DNA replication and repair protein RecF
MFLRALYLHQFRLYEEALFEFSPKVNIIRGSNARGKTSLLEAIYFLMTGRSFRTAQLSDLIRHGAQFFYLEASFVKHGIEQKVRIYCNGKERKVTHNNSPCQSAIALLGLLQGAVIHPDDAAIVKGAPAARRHLLDLQLAQSDPLYVHHLTRYGRAMRQRNALLRAKSAAAIESWEYEMANAASYIIQQRARAVDHLQKHGKVLYSGICGGSENLSLRYKAHGIGDHPLTDLEALRSVYCDNYCKHRRREMDLGMTLTGPHKDDVMIVLDNKDARAFASEGQQRSCVVALRLAEWERLKGASQEVPLMLVDDLGMSLDNSRRSQLLGHFSALEQVFITTTEEGILVPNEHEIRM